MQIKFPRGYKRTDKTKKKKECGPTNKSDLGYLLPNAQTLKFGTWYRPQICNPESFPPFSFQRTRTALKKQVPKYAIDIIFVFPSCYCRCFPLCFPAHKYPKSICNWKFSPSSLERKLFVACFRCLWSFSLKKD